MNEVFETLSDVFEELRSESEDREYSVQTEEAKAASRELRRTGSIPSRRRKQKQPAGN